jgi:hypothetical protein
VIKRLENQIYPHGLGLQLLGLKNLSERDVYIDTLEVLFYGASTKLGEIKKVLDVER